MLGAAVATENPHLQRAVKELESLDEAGALRTLEKARTWPKNSPHDLALVHLYLGLAHAGLSHGKQAVDAFQAALLLEPTLVLPPDASPRIREWWVKAGGEGPRAAAVVEAPKNVEPVEPPQPPPPVKLTPVAVEPPPPAVVIAPAQSSRVPGFVLLGAGVVVAATSGAGLVHSLNVASAYARQQPDHAMPSAPTVSRADAGLARTLYPLSMVALAVGVVLSGLGVWRLLAG